MEKMVAFCGISCADCGAFLATRNNDDEKRKDVALLWSRQFHQSIKPEDINCDGCHSEGGLLFNYCNVCEIRNCGKEKKLENCTQCDQYVCEKLEKFFQMAPDAKNLLDEIKKSL